MVDKTAATIKLKEKISKGAMSMSLACPSKLNLQNLSNYSQRMSKGAMSMSLACPAESGL